MINNTQQIEALIQAITDNAPDKVKALLEQGVDPNLCLDDDGITPLHFAAQHNAVLAAKYLITAGADAFAITIHDEVTPLDIAKLHKHQAMIKLLESYKKGSQANN